MPVDLGPQYEGGDGVDKIAIDYLVLVLYAIQLLRPGVIPEIALNSRFLGRIIEYVLHTAHAVGLVVVRPSYDRGARLIHASCGK